MLLKDYNAQQAGMCERLADALDDFIAASAHYRAEIAADEDRPPTIERDASALERAYRVRQQASFAVAARVQDLAGVQFHVTSERVF